MSECSKIAYPSPQAASKAVQQIKTRRRQRPRRFGGDWDGGPLRHYRCPDCGLWHLTSNPRRPRR